MLTSKDEKAAKHPLIQFPLSPEDLNGLKWKSLTFLWFVLYMTLERGTLNYSMSAM